MKKIVTILMVAGLAACASKNSPECQYQRYERQQPVVYEMKQTMELVQFCRHPYAVG